MKILKQFIAQIKDANKDDRTITAYVSTIEEDRAGEYIPSGEWKLENYRKNPVILWAHNYSLPPVAKALWSKTDDKGLIQKIQFAKTAFAQDIFDLYDGGFLNAFSVGFRADRDSSDSRIFRNCELLEVSCVPVPCNANALAERAHSGLIKTPEALAFVSKMLEDLNKQSNIEKGVIPYKDLGKEDEGATWNGPKEIASADVAGLKTICTWFDNENAENKSAYKLPHHRESSHKAVWKGVAAAMAALLGARGGVTIPDADRKGVYDHLSKHYQDFGKTAPDFKSYTDEEIKSLFTELPEESEKELQYILERNELIAEIARLKSGRVLSAKNRELISSAAKALQELLDATDPAQEDDDKSIPVKENNIIKGIKIINTKPVQKTESLAEITREAVKQADIPRVIRRELNRLKGTVEI